MKDVDRDEIRREFEAGGIQGRTPEETEEMIDSFAQNLQLVFDGIERFTNRPEPRERSAQTAQAMRREIEAFLETYKTYAAGEFITPFALKYLKQAIAQETEENFFGYLEVVGRERERLYQLFNLNLYVKD